MYAAAYHKTVFGIPDKLFVRVGFFTCIGSFLNDLAVFVKAHGIFGNKVHIICGCIVCRIMKTVAICKAGVLCAYFCGSLVHKLHKGVLASGNKLCKNKCGVISGTNYKVIEKLVRGKNIA